MASTPPYKKLKANGTSFYAFPGAAEDISVAYQNANYKMYFSKYALLNLPKHQTQVSSMSPARFKSTKAVYTRSQTSGATSLFPCAAP